MRGRENLVLMQSITERIKGKPRSHCTYMLSADKASVIESDWVSIKKSGRVLSKEVGICRSCNYMQGPD